MDEGWFMMVMVKGPSKHWNLYTCGALRRAMVYEEWIQLYGWNNMKIIWGSDDGWWSQWWWWGMVTTVVMTMDGDHSGEHSEVTTMVMDMRWRQWWWIWGDWQTPSLYKETALRRTDVRYDAIVMGCSRCNEAIWCAWNSNIDENWEMMRMKSTVHSSQFRWEAVSGVLLVKIKLQWIIGRSRHDE